MSDTKKLDHETKRPKPYRRNPKHKPFYEYDRDEAWDEPAPGVKSYVDAGVVREAAYIGGYLNEAGLVFQAAISDVNPGVRTLVVHWDPKARWSVNPFTRSLRVIIDRLARIHEGPWDTVRLNLSDIKEERFILWQEFKAWADLAAEFLVGEGILKQSELEDIDWSVMDPKLVEMCEEAIGEAIPGNLYAGLSAAPWAVLDEYNVKITLR